MPKNLTYDNARACCVAYGTPAANTTQGGFSMQNRKLNPHPSAAELEDIASHLWCAIGTVDAVHTAMTDSHNDPASYTDALLGAILLLQQIAGELDAQVYRSEDA